MYHSFNEFIIKNYPRIVEDSVGELEKNEGNPVEVGVLCIVTSSRNKLSTEIAKLINPFLLHFPLTIDEELPIFAFPYSPVHSDRGCVYEFSSNHLLELNNPMDAIIPNPQIINPDSIYP